MATTTEIDTDAVNTSKLIDKIMKGDEKDITKQDNLIAFPEDKNDVMYDDSLKNVFVAPSSIVTN